MRLRIRVFTNIHDSIRTKVISRKVSLLLLQNLFNTAAQTIHEKKKNRKHFHSQKTPIFIHRFRPISEGKVGMRPLAALL